MTFWECLDRIKEPDAQMFRRAQEKWLTVAKPLFSLGRLETLVSRIVMITGDIKADVSKKALVIMCADNGVVAEGVTQCDSSITAMVTENFTKRRASVSIMAERTGCDVIPIDIGVMTDVPGVTQRDIKIRRGTDNIARGAAMTYDETIRAIEIGINAVQALKQRGYRLIATGEMGIGNTTTSAAVLSVLLDMAPETVTGRGAGLSTDGLKRKIDVISHALMINKPDKNDIIDVLSKVGGLDIAGLCGVFLGGAACGVPVIIDGLISAAAALCAARMNDSARGYMIPSHLSKEPAGGAVLRALELEPYFDCGMFLGEGSGAVMLMPLIDMACDVYRDMPTFDSWDRDGYEILK